MRGMTFTTAAAVALAAVILASCGTEATAPGGAVAAIRITPAIDTLGTLGGTRQLSAAALDQNGAPVAGATITWRSSAPGVISVDSVTGLVTALANGSATITASAGGKSASASLTVAQVIASITITPASAALSALGAAQAFSAVAKDSGGSVVSGTRFLWISSDPTVAVVDTNGLATAKGPGSATITAAGRGIPGSAQLTVTQTARRVAFTVEPSGVVAGAALSPAVQVTIEDSTGARVRDATDAVTLALGANPGGATLSGTVTVNAVDGVATFSGLSLDKADTGYTLSATAGGLAAGTSVTFGVTAATPAQLGFVTEPPASVTAGVAFAPAVAVEDRFGNVVTSATNSVALALAANPDSAPLGGTATAAAVNGVATFAGVHVDRAAAGYALGATAAGLTGATSTAFAVIAAGPVRLGFVPNPYTISTQGQIPVNPPLEVAVQDSFGNTVLGATDTVHLALAYTPIRDALNGDTVAVTASGVAQFANSSLDNPIPYNNSVVDILAAAAAGLATGYQGVLVHLTFDTAGAAGLAGATVHSCAITSAAAVYCWGTGRRGQLGDGDTTNLGASGSFWSPVAALGGIGTVTAVSTGGEHSCAVTTAGAGYCWGANAHGELGDGLTSDTALPARIGGAFTWASVSAGPSHTCGVTTNSAAYCWGNDSSGALGDGTRNSSATWVVVAGGLSFAAVSAAGVTPFVSTQAEFTCGLTVAGAAYCWGSNGWGELGDSALADTTLPVAVKGGIQFKAVTAGGGHACGLDTRGFAWCWGANFNGELGSGDTASVAIAPVPVAGGIVFRSLSAGGHHTCGVSAYTGAAYCWGSNANGQLGNGTFGDSRVPVAVTGGFAFVSIGAGDSHTCGVTTAGVAYCWGANGNGQLGNNDGAHADSPVPVRVVQ